MDDRPMVERMNELAREEEQLWEQAGDGDGLSDSQRDRLETIRVQLDQCYDLLRQRGARRAAETDPVEAEPGSADIAERHSS
jgi:uncharacterized protein DUF2630